MTKRDRKGYYDDNFSSVHAHGGSRPNIPDDIQRVCFHEPCFMCGIARGPCRHRVIYD